MTVGWCTPGCRFSKYIEQNELKQVLNIIAKTDKRLNPDPNAEGSGELGGKGTPKRRWSAEMPTKTVVKSVVSKQMDSQSPASAVPRSMSAAVPRSMSAAVSGLADRQASMPAGSPPLAPRFSLSLVGGVEVDDEPLDDSPLDDLPVSRQSAGSKHVSFHSTPNQQ